MTVEGIEEERWVSEAFQGLCGAECSGKFPEFLRVTLVRTPNISGYLSLKRLCFAVKQVFL